MVLAHNMAAEMSNRQLGISVRRNHVSSERLASGYRINRAADDGAGLAITEEMRGQIRGLNRASLNSDDGISLVQTAEGGMSEIQEILKRMEELSVQAANDTYTDEDRETIQNEMEQLIDEIDGIVDRTEFNTMKLLNGNYAQDGLKMQVGSNTGEMVEIRIAKLDAEGLGLKTGATYLDVTTQPTADASIDTVLKAIELVSDQRVKLGACQNRMDHAVSSADNSSENLQSAESKMRDTNMAQEMVQNSATQILMQAGQSMLAQSNSATQGVLTLLR